MRCSAAFGRQVLAGLALLLASAGSVQAGGSAQAGGGPGRDLVAAMAAGGKAQPAFANRLLARAQPDECYDGIGAGYPALGADGTCAAGRAKTNQAYVWGLVQAGRQLWFGTAPNVHCLVIGGFLGSTRPGETESWVCEHGESQIARGNPALPDAIGDWRPPRAYAYDLQAGRLTDRTPAHPLFAATLGIRSAGTRGGVVFLAGPALSPGGGVNFFAFSSATGSLVDACAAPAFTNIRQWAVARGALYAGVGTATGGGVIRWTGTRADPFKRRTQPGSTTCGFHLASVLPGDAAHLTRLGADRLAVSAWPTGLGSGGGGGAGVYLSPPLGRDGLTPADGPWQRLWAPTDYEPDLVTALTYAGGAIAEWRGALYFATMHVPGLSAVVHASDGCRSDARIGSRCFGEPASPEAALQLFLGSYRAISVWRIAHPATAPRVELLYGEAKLPAYDEATQAFALRSTGFTPLFGPSGFGNPFNNYGWTANVVDGQLLFGTMDWSYVLASSLEALIPGVPPELAAAAARIDPGRAGFGADLWRFPSPGRPAVPEDLGGAGNFLNYGIRSAVVAADKRSLFLGTANPMNLEELGGWELRRLARRR